MPRVSAKLLPALIGRRWITSSKGRAGASPALSSGGNPFKDTWANGFPSAWTETAKKPEVDVQSLSTRHGYVTVPPNGDLTWLRSYDADQSLCGLPTVQLADDHNTEPRTEIELEAKRKEIIELFHNTMTMFEKSCELFKNTTDFYEKHEELRHPPIFYLGHTATFYTNKLHLGKFINTRLDPVLEMQMAVGVDEMTWDDIDSNSYVWPSGAEARADPEAATEFFQKVLNYRRDVRVLVENRMKKEPMIWPIKKDSFWYIIMMGIEHDRIHLETSSVATRQAPMSRMQSSGVFPTCEEGLFHTSPKEASGVPDNSLLPVEAGSTRLGRSWEGTKTYGWDNEFGREIQKEVPAFKASEYLVSNKEFFDFVDAGGYTTEKFWSEEGWQWKSAMQPRHPRFWVLRGGNKYFLRTLTEEVPMPWDWPAEVCHHEAAAFCAYLAEKTGKPIRLPMEDECMRLRDMVPEDLQNSAHGPAWGSRSTTPGNINLAYWASPCPVDRFRSPTGVCDVLGNVWQHCATDIDVLEGFETHPLYEDFSTPTVDGLHARIMGGSFLSTGTAGATRDSRFGFRRHFYQHAGFRYVASDRPLEGAVFPYERDWDLVNKLRFHFDPPALGGESFHVQLADACMATLRTLSQSPDATRALELGCGPGRTTLELARRGLLSVHAADQNAKGFQLTAQRLLAGPKLLRWMNFLEGEFVEARELPAQELGLTEDLPVQFHQIPDFAAADLKKFNNYDLVVFAEPGALGSTRAMDTLASVHKLMKPGALLVVGTQYEWAAPATAAGTIGEEVLASTLATWFDAVAEPRDLPFAWNQTSRKVESGLQHVTFWQRRASASDSASRELTEATMAQSNADASAGQAMYDCDDVVGQYLDFHFGPGSDYPAACAAHCVEAARQLKVPLNRALEVGGGPGRAALELAKSFGHVDGGDYSQSFTELGQKLCAGEELQWRVPVDGTERKWLERSISAESLGLAEASAKTHLTQLDAHNLPAELKGYDLICGFNLVDRLAEPKKFLLEAKERLNVGGLLVISSPYTWLEQFTPKENWLGGFKYGDNDGPTSYEGIKELLVSEGFVEAKKPIDVQFQIDELANGRKSQQTQAQMTFWKRVA